MAEVVIKLSDELVEAIRSPANNWSCGNPVIDKAIKEGIVLPKGHGALKDIDTVLLDLRWWDGRGYDVYMYAEPIVNKIPPLVPADENKKPCTATGKCSKDCRFYDPVFGCPIHNASIPME